MNQAGGNGGESTESCGRCFGDASQGAGPALVASMGPPMSETEQGWEPAREELLGTGVGVPRRGRPRSCVGEAFLPGLDGDRGFIYSAHGLSLPILSKHFHLGHGHLPAKLGLARAALWSGQTTPGDGAGLARHLSDGLPRWVRPELRLAPGLTGTRSCSVHNAPAAQVEAPTPGTAARPAWAGGWWERQEEKRSPAFRGCQFGRKAWILGQFSTPFGSPVA